MVHSQPQSFQNEKKERKEFSLVCEITRTSAEESDCGMYVLKSSVGYSLQYVFKGLTYLCSISVQSLTQKQDCIIVTFCQEIDVKSVQSALTHLQTTSGPRGTFSRQNTTRECISITELLQCPIVVPFGQVWAKL